MGSDWEILVPKLELPNLPLTIENLDSWNSKSSWSVVSSMATTAISGDLTRRCWPWPAIVVAPGVPSCWTFWRKATMGDWWLKLDCDDEDFISKTPMYWLYIYIWMYIIIHIYIYWWYCFYTQKVLFALRLRPSQTIGWKNTWTTLNKKLC